MLPQSYPNYKTVHRRFQAWCRDEILRRLLTVRWMKKNASSTRRS
jgi:transposase